MIKSVNLNYVNTNFKANPTNNERINDTQIEANELKLADYKVGQAILNRNNIVFHNNSNVNEVADINSAPEEKDSCTISLKYPYQAKNLKDQYIAQYTNDLIIFLTPPFHSTDSDIVVNDKNSNLGNYHNLIFSVPNEKDSKELVKKQQEILLALYNTDFSLPLDGIKTYSIELINEDSNLTPKEKQDRVDLTNSITVEDIKTHMGKYLLNKTPVEGE